MGLNERDLDNFVKTQSCKITKTSIVPNNNGSFIDTKGNTIPAKKNQLIENFDLENEVETETDILPSIEFTSCYFNFNNLQCLFLNVYSTYSCATIKVEFLDIFSPPPNC
jgi:hypothetical protein